MDTILTNPYIQYLVSPAVVFSFVLFVAYKILNLGSLIEQFKTVTKDVENLKSDNKKLLGHIYIIKTHLVDKTGLDSGLFGAASPLRLLQKGEDLLNKSGFKKVFEENKEWFVDEVKKYKVKNIAEIDEATFKIMSKCRDNDKFIDYKQIAYLNGVSIDVLLRICSIYLRDEISKIIKF